MCFVRKFFGELNYVLDLFSSEIVHVDHIDILNENSGLFTSCDHDIECLNEFGAFKH